MPLFPVILTDKCRQINRYCNGQKCFGNAAAARPHARETSALMPWLATAEVYSWIPSRRELAACQRISEPSCAFMSHSDTAWKVLAYALYYSSRHLRPPDVAETLRTLGHSGKPRLSAPLARPPAAERTFSGLPMRWAHHQQWLGIYVSRIALPSHCIGIKDSSALPGRQVSIHP